MKINITKESFLEGIQIISGVSGRATLPILYNFLMEASSGKVKLTRTDMEMATIHNINAEVIEEGAITIPLKEFSDIILFEGDNTSLINYFKSLFNIDIYGEDVVNKRLSKLELGCQLSDKKHREVLEAILPSFKNFDKNGEVKKIV